MKNKVLLLLLLLLFQFLLLLFGFFDKPTITFVINSPTFLNSFNPNPLVVAAGVPSLIPDVIVVFLYQKEFHFCCK